MTRGKPGANTTQQVVSSAMGAAQALTAGMLQLAERTLRGTLRAAEGVGSEIGGTLARATRSSLRAASDLGGELAGLARRATTAPAGSQRKPLAKSRTRRRRRRGAA